MGGSYIRRNEWNPGELVKAYNTLNCFRPRLHEPRLIFKTAYPFTWIRADEALNHSRDRFQKDSRLI